MVTAHALLLTFALAAPGETVLLEFTASWCEPCRLMEPVVSRLTEAGFPVQQIDVDQHPDLVDRFGVTAVPCFIMLSDGQEVDRIEGGVSYARLLQMYERARASAAAISGKQQVRGQSPERRPGRLGLLNLLGRNAQSTAAAPSQPPAGEAPPADPLQRIEMPQAAPVAVAVPARSEATAPEPSAAPPVSTVDPAEAALAATVRIKVEDGQGHSFGTGTVIDRHGNEVLAVTCGHIFRDSQGKGRITVDLFGAGRPQQIPGTLISYDLDRDIGLISFAPGTAMQPARVAPAGHRLQPGTAVFSIGCNHGDAPSIQTSRITAVDKYLGPPNIEVAGQPVDGRSGGGLFTADGWLIGICNAADPADNEGIYASLPTIHLALDRIGQRRIYDLPQVAVGGQADNAQMPSEMPHRQAADALAATRGTAGAPPAGGDTEVICIVRSRAQNGAPDRLLVLNQPSAELLERIAAESTRAAAPSDSLVPLSARDLSTLAPVVRAQSADSE